MGFAARMEPVMIGVGRSSFWLKKSETVVVDAATAVEARMRKLKCMLQDARLREKELGPSPVGKGVFASVFK